jgi:hypothetical protein
LAARNALTQEAAAASRPERKFVVAGLTAQDIADAGIISAEGLSRGFGVLDRCLERSHLIRGRRQEAIDDGGVAVGQGLSARQAIADEAHKVRAIHELAVIGRVRRLDVREIEDITCSEASRLL